MSGPKTVSIPAGCLVYRVYPVYICYNWKTKL